MDSQRGLYEKLILPIEGQMIRCVWRVVRNAADAEDAFQDALATIFKRIDQIEHHPNPPALILRICANAAYDSLRRSVTRRKHETLGAVTVDSADPAPGTVEKLVGKEQRKAVLQAISRLPRRQAEAVLLRLVFNLSYGDIAQAMECEEATVRTHFTRGRAWLSQELASSVETSFQEKNA